MKPQHSTWMLLGIVGAFATGCTFEEGPQTPVASTETPVGEDNAADTTQVGTVQADAGAQTAGGETETADYVDGPGAFTAPPPLVSVDSDVSVVEDYDTPVYYEGGYYWDYRDGGWYRAQYWDSPWVSVDIGYVPGTLIHRDHHHYVHYHPNESGAHVWHEPNVQHHHADHREPNRASTGHQGDRRRPDEQPRPVVNRSPAAPTRVNDDRRAPIERARPAELARPAPVTRTPEPIREPARAEPVREPARAPEPAGAPERAAPPRPEAPHAAEPPKSQAPPVRRAPAPAAPARGHKR